jgi:hypothetical protein
MRVASLVAMSSPTRIEKGFWTLVGDERVAFTDCSADLFRDSIFGSLSVDDPTTP